MIFCERNSIFMFICALEDLISSGIPLSKSVKAISRIPNFNKKVRNAAEEISESLGNGSNFYLSLEKVSSINIPFWLLLFVSCSEKSGTLALTLKQIKQILEKQKKNKEKFVSAVSYPVFIAVSGLLFGLFAFHFLSDFNFDSFDVEKSVEISVFSSLFPALIFLFASYSFIFIFMKKVFDGNSVVFIFRSLSFLSENSVPVLEGIKTCFSFAEKNKNLEAALLLCEEKIEKGGKISKSFAESFSESGFKKESEILSLNLSICEMTGKNDGFSKTADFFDEKRNKRIEKFLAFLQPVLMFITAIYLWLVLKNIFLPVISGFGGI